MVEWTDLEEEIHTTDDAVSKGTVKSIRASSAASASEADMISAGTGTEAEVIPLEEEAEEVSVRYIYHRVSQTTGGGAFSSAG